MRDPIDDRAEQRGAVRADGDGTESFSFEAVADDGTALLVRWTFLGSSRIGRAGPGERAEPTAATASERCWYWAYLVEPEGSVWAVRDHELSLPRGRTLEVRGDGIWAEGVCEVPHEHWSLGLEAFAVRMEDPAQGWHGERGDRLPFGFELDFDAADPSREIDGGYAQMGRLGGELIVGRTRRPVDVRAARTHRSLPASEIVELRSERDGRVVGTPLVPTGLERSADGLVVAASAEAGHFVVDAAMAIPAPPTRIFVGAGRLVSDTDGESASGWLEVHD